MPKITQQKLAESVSDLAEALLQNDAKKVFEGHELVGYGESVEIDEDDSE